MKLKSILMLASCVYTSTVSASTLKELRETWKKAHETQNYDLIWESTYYGEETDEEYLKVAKAQGRQGFDAFFSSEYQKQFGKPVFGEVIEMKSIPQPPVVANGYIYKGTIDALGELKMPVKLTKSNQEFDNVISYGKVNGKYYFVGNKREKLDWEGPKDKQFSFSSAVDLPEGEQIVLDVTYNISGVSITEKFTLSGEGGGFSSTNLFGQHIEKISVYSGEFNSIELKIIDNDRKTVFEKKYTKGKKNLYKK